MNRREGVLEAVRAASELHEELELRKIFKANREQINIFKCMHDIGLTVLCRPLDGLLGAYYPNGQESGVLITTKRRLSVQRFTAAHELGHHILGHEESLDSEKDIHLARQGIVSVPLQEIQAETFASEFLLPKWLIFGIIKSQAWKKADIHTPSIVYQLALRAGVSYIAMCIALINHNFIDQKALELLKGTQPKIIKNKILDTIRLDDSWSDACHLTLPDSGTHLYLSPEDMVIVQLPEHSSSGYTWTNPNNISPLFDEREQYNQDTLGGLTSRKIAFQSNHRVHLSMQEMRQWEKCKAPLNTFDVTLDFNGKEEGLPRAARL